MAKAKLGQKDVVDARIITPHKLKVTKPSSNSCRGSYLF